MPAIFIIFWVNLAKKANLNKHWTLPVLVTNQIWTKNVCLQYVPSKPGKMENVGGEHCTMKVGGAQCRSMVHNSQQCSGASQGTYKSRVTM